MQGDFSVQYKLVCTLTESLTGVMFCGGTTVKKMSVFCKE